MKTILLQKGRGKERFKNYSTSLAWLCNRSGVVFQSFFTTTFLQQGSVLVFLSLACFCTLTDPSLIVVNFSEKSFSLVGSFFCCLTAYFKRGSVVSHSNFNNSVEDQLKRHCNSLFSCFCTFYRPISNSSQFLQEYINETTQFINKYGSYFLI